MNLFNIRKNAKRDLHKELEKDGLVNIRGELEIEAFKNGKKIHEDKGENMVTIFAKHATMHLLTGETFTTHGTQRSFTGHDSTTPGEGTNPDGTLLSGQQFFSNNSNPDFDIDSRWSRSTITPNTDFGDSSPLPDQVRFPFFPTKMLFGTGFEWRSWADIPLEYRDQYESEGWNQSVFENVSIDSGSNNYSEELSGANVIIQKRSMNDIFSGSLTTPAILDTDFGISGAIKNGTYTDSAIHRGTLNAGGSGADPRTEVIVGNEFLLRQFQGIGAPSFIYARRENRFFQEGSEIALSADDKLENKISFSVTMPEQTGDDQGIFYPYNGYTLKVAGLFSDARLVLGNTVPVNVDGGLVNFNSMPHGIMFAKRYIAPITKTHDVSIRARWTLYL